jgi:hypothetical protein
VVVVMQLQYSGRDVHFYSRIIGLFSLDNSYSVDAGGSFTVCSWPLHFVEYSGQECLSILYLVQLLQKYSHENYCIKNLTLIVWCWKHPKHCSHFWSIVHPHLNSNTPDSPTNAVWLHLRHLAVNHGGGKKCPWILLTAYQSCYARFFNMP